IPRPPNAFILYRQDKQPELLEQLQATCSKSLNSKDMSILIGRMWKEESAEEKQRYKNMSSQIKREHQEKYPNFKYS
ncbi:putative HMG box protein, partial [Chytridium lagenaria]